MHLKSFKFKIKPFLFVFLYNTKTVFRIFGQYIPEEEEKQFILLFSQKRANIALAYTSVIRTPYQDLVELAKADILEHKSQSSELSGLVAGGNLS